MQPLIDSLADNPAMLLGLILGSLGIVATVLVVGLAAGASVRNAREREQSRREVAAYVAEGSMTAEDAERVLQPKPWFARGSQRWRQGSSQQPVVQA